MKSHVTLSSYEFLNKVKVKVPYICQFNLDFYETLNLSSWGPKLSTPVCLPQMATLGVGVFPYFHYFPIYLQNQHRFL